MLRPYWTRGLSRLKQNRGLITGAMFFMLAMGSGGCGGALSYVYRNVSPIHPTGWSFAWPILPSQQQKIERDFAREEDDRVAILDPIPADSTSSPCLDPPSDAEVWEKVPKMRHSQTVLYETQRNNVQILIEKIGETVDPCKVYPLAGPCQLVHCHYKCTVYYDENYWADYPIPYNLTDHKVEVVYIDKDHLRRCAGPVTTSPNGP